MRDSAEDSGPTIIELRIHGGGGSTVQDMLGPDVPRQQLTSDADERSGFWSWTERRNGVERRAYLWGRSTPLSLAVWLVLLPFTLVNAAGWAVASGTRLSDGWFDKRRRRWGAAVSRWCVAALGVSLTAGWTLWMVRIVGVRHALPDRASWSAVAAGLALTVAFLVQAVRIGLGVRKFRQRVKAGIWVWIVAAATVGLIASDGLGLRGKWATALALAASAAATAIPFVLAGSNRKRFEQYRARLGGTGVARERRRLGDEETLDAPCFYDHPTDSTAILLVHGLVAASLLSVIAARAFILQAANPASEQPLLDLERATPFVGHALLGVGLVQAVLVCLLVVGGILGTSRTSFGRDQSWVNRFVNALRAASLAGLGVFLFTAVVASIDSLAALYFDEAIGLGTHPELELTPAFAGGALLATLLVAVGAALFAWKQAEPAPEDQVPDPLDGAWRKWRTMRWVVANADRVVVVYGAAIGITLAVAALVHRWDDGFPLVPEGEFKGPEDLAFRLMPSLGVVVLALPALVLVLARLSGRFRYAVSSLWDVLSFWPRRFHPLGIPPEAERAVPEVQSHLLHALEDKAARVRIVAHSQGSVIAFAALVGLRDRAALDQVSLVTLGSPLFALYPRMFPAQVSDEVTDELARTLGPQRWVNLWRATDFFGTPPDASVEITDAQVPHVSRPDAAGPAAPVLLAHRGYWGSGEVEDWIARRPEDPQRPPGHELPAVVPSFAPRRRMVSWLDPRLLALTAYQAGVSAVFGKWADARRIQAIETQAFPPPGLDLAPLDEVWVDYVADAGDAFAPTFAVASALAQPVLEVDGQRPLPRGDVLVMGGDEVYPAASLARYENQLVGPYALASECAQTGGNEGRRRPLLLAVPGNHDWYDGLRSFDQVFCGGNSIGMWLTRQERSYWVSRLTRPPSSESSESSGSPGSPGSPGSGSSESGSSESGSPGPRPPTWWLWGVDLQLDNRFDRRQRDYFRSQAERLQEGDFIILCSPIPTWAHASEEPTAFDVLSELVAEVRVSARVVLHLSGDSHHFARYERQQLRTADSGELEVVAPASGLLPVQYVTTGGGGAFTHPTHHLPDYVDLPVPYDDGATTLTLQSRGGMTGKPMPRPDAGHSRRLIFTNLRLLRFLRQNLAFALLPGVVATVVAFAVLRRQRVGPGFEAGSLRELAGTLASNPLSLGLILLVIAGWMAFAKPAPGGSPLSARAIGLLHGGFQVTAMAAVLWAGPGAVADLHRLAAQPTRHVLRTDLPSWLVGALDWVALLSIVGVLAGIAGALILALYLVGANLVGKMHDNEAASAVASEAFNHFVRICIKGDTATVWVLHVPDPKRIAERFAAHDPRPRQIPDDLLPKVELWDCFDIGKKPGSEPQLADGLT